MGLFTDLGGAPAAVEAPASQADTAAQAAIETQQPAAAAPAPVAEAQQNQQPNTPATPVAPVDNAQQAAEPDYDAIFDKMSGGVIKNVDSFKAALPQIQAYGTLKQERDDLAAKMAQAPVFADDEVRILNDLKSSGATKEQIKQFQAINEYGTIMEMPDKDALIASMVMNGTKPSTAALKVERDFKLNDENLDPAERELLDDDLRVAAKEAREGLEKLKAKVSDVAQTAPEETQLQLTAKTMAHQAAVKPYVSDVISNIPHLGELTVVPGKDGAEPVKFTLPIDDSVKAELKGYVENYFMDGLVPVTPEATVEALSYARAEYFRVHSDEFAQKVWAEAVSKTTEALVAKYENRSGLKPQQDGPIVPGTNDAAATADFAQRMANRQLK